MASLYITKRDADRFNVNQNGSVPKPTASDVSNNRVLQADGSWVAQSGGGGGGGSHTYSTAEQVVGTWIDGKPVYEITLHFTVLNQNYLPAGIDEIIDISCMLQASSDNWWRPIPWLYASGSSIQTGAWAGGFGVIPSTGEVAFQLGNNLGAISKGIIVARYTKTAD